MMNKTPLTDAKLVELDMQDLEFSHKYREVVSFCKEIEGHYWKQRELTEGFQKLAIESMKKLSR